MSTAEPTPFSLRPWPRGDRKPHNLGEFIARVQAERGGFRNVTEESVGEELAATPEDGVAAEEQATDEDAVMEDEAEGAAETGSTAPKDAAAARNDMLRNVECVVPPPASFRFAVC
jgi:mediator of RNA polymerase II transcription subunit 17